MKNNVFDAGPSPFGGPENPFVVPNDHAIGFFQESVRTLTLDNGEQKAIIDFGGDEVTTLVTYPSLNRLNCFSRQYSHIGESHD